MNERIGIIGVGLVGMALAERLLRVGYAVSGYDVDAARMTRLRSLGGDTASTGAEVAQAAGRVILSLPTSAIAGEVLCEIRGSLQRGGLVMDTTTGAAEDAERFGSEMAALGVDYVDATIGGSSRQVREGEAIMICGGSAAAYARCGDLFPHLCGRVFHVGPVGGGARMKLVMNLVLGLNRAVLAEGLSYARRVGLDAGLALEVLKAGPAYSTAMDVKGEKMLQEEFTPEARLSQHRKDVGLILESGREAGARLPLSAVHYELLQEAERLGLGAADNSAIIKVF